MELIPQISTGMIFEETDSDWIFRLWADFPNMSIDCFFDKHLSAFTPYNTPVNNFCKSLILKVLVC